MASQNDELVKCAYSRRAHAAPRARFFMPTVREARNVRLKPRVNELAAGSTDVVEARLEHLDEPTRDLRHRSLFGISI